MEASVNVFSDLFDRIRAWIPHRPDTTSRDFWMPDRICRKCYDCDSQFTIFNRRHHCRICGKVFCGLCSVNTIQVAVARHNGAYEEGDRVRVCNYCYKVSRQGNGDDVLQPEPEPDSGSPPMTPSSRHDNLAGIEMNGGAAPLAMSARSPSSLTAASTMDDKTSKLRILHGTLSNYDSVSSMPGDEQPPSPPTTYGNRSDDEDEYFQRDYARYERLADLARLDGEEYEDESLVDLELPEHRRSQSSKYSSQSSDASNIPAEDPDGSARGARSDSKTADSGTTADSIQRPRLPAKQKSSNDMDGLEEDYTPFKDVYDYELQKPVDYENNALLWDPPPPEEENGELGTAIVDDDDEDDEDEGGWLPRSVGSMSSSEFKMREKAALRDLVDGHFRALVAKLLEVAGLEVLEEEEDPDSWLSIVTSLSLQAASLVKPDRGGGAMDPGNYVKVKCLASGHPRDSLVVKGVVCKKNVHNKRMTSRYKNPRILLLGGALEYQRVSNQLSSIETLLQQEQAHIKMTVDRIEQHHPNVLLVEKTVSGHAQELLLNKDISLVLNVKKRVMERIARCTGAQIFQSCESLMIAKAGHCGHCETFHVDKHVEEHGSAGSVGEKRTKTLMFFEECPRPVGCTILLRGANGDVLKKVKSVVQYAVFAAYHLALETSFLADEGATLPDCPLNITVALSNNQAHFDRSISSVPGFTLPVPTHLRVADFRPNQIRTVVPNSMSVSPMPLGFPGAVPAGTVLTSTSPQISPAVDTAATSPVRTTIGFTSTIIKGQSPYPTGNGLQSESLHVQKGLGVSGLSASLRQATQENGHVPSAVTLISQVSDNSGSEAVVSSLSNGGYSASIVHETGKIGSEILHASGNLLDQSPMWSANGKIGESDLVTLDRQSLQIDFGDNHLVEEQDGKEDFPPSPSDLQSILVSMSSRCLRKGTVCERPHIFRIKYYGTTDKPLGRYLRESLFDTSNCRSCDEPLDAHIHCFTHRQGSLTISVQRLNDRPPLAGEREGKIWMWHRCLLCPRVDGVPPATRRVVMSDAAWGLSFGKFLELSFSNHAAASRLAACGHSLHRDCLRFYGFGNAVACFRYAPIILNSVLVPPAKLDFSNCARQEWLQQEVEEIGEKGEKVFAEVFDTLRVFGEKIASSGPLCSGWKAPEARRRIVELEERAQIHKADFEDALQTAAPFNLPPDQPLADVLELNRLRRVLLECAIYWDDQFNKLIANLRSKKSPGSEANLLDDSSIKLAKQTSFGGNSGKSLGSQDGEADSEGSNGRLTRSNSKVLNDKANGPPTMEVNGDDVSSQGAAAQIGPSQVPLDMDAASPPSVVAGPDDLAPVLDGPSVISVLAVHGDSGEDGTELVALGQQNVPVAVAIGDDLMMADDATMKNPVVATSLQLSDNPLVTVGPLDTGNVQPLAGDVSMKAAEDSPNAGPPQGDDASREESPPKQEVSGAHIEKMGEVDTVPLKVVLGNVAREKEVNDQDAALQSTPSSPTKVISNAIDREFSTPFLHLYRSNSRASSSIAGSPPRSEARRPIAQSTICKSAADGGARVLLPPGRDNIIVAVYDDEPTTVIAYALASEDYQKDLNKRESSESKDTGLSHPLQTNEGAAETLDKPGSTRAGAVGDPLLHTEPMDVVTLFEDGNGSGKMKYSVRSYYAKHFDALRKKCCDGDLNFLRSLSRCRKWGAQGGKSNVFFAKTADDRFVVKQVTRTESVSFRDFAPEYFKYLSEYIDSGSPTCLAKILGLYQVTIKRAGKEIQKMDLLVMENLFYGRSLSRVYDLKGSVRSRYNDSKASNVVLLDENLLEAMPTAPIFVGNKAKRLLERAVWNDTAFLATVQVMDYSLLVGIDEERQELAIGIIDFIRQYTWDKQLETWVKASGILGGPKNAAPTVISPKQYKKRFRKAMSTYFLMVPDQCWSPPPIISTPTLALSEDLGNGRFLLDDEIGEDSSKRL